MGCHSLTDNPQPLFFSLPSVALFPMEDAIPSSRDLRDGVTCKSVATLVPQIPHCLQHLLPRGVSTQVPLRAGIAAVLGQPWGRKELLASRKTR